MKNIIIAATIILLMFTYSCSSDTEAENIETENILPVTEKTNNTVSEKIKSDTLTNTKQVKAAKITQYICPNNCLEGKLNKEGDCPKCGMSLIENPDF